MESHNAMSAVSIIRVKLTSAKRLVRNMAMLPKTTHQFALETEGTEFVLWSSHSNDVAANLQKTCQLPLTIESLSRAMADVDYCGQSIVVILHPPCVCLKTFQIPPDNPSRWLAAHLTEIAPPGNRRDQVVSYHCNGAGQMRVAFARRQSLLGLGKLFCSAGVSVQEVQVGGEVGSNFFSSANRQLSECFVSFSLCSYRFISAESSLEVYPVLNTNHTSELLVESSLSDSHKSVSSRSECGSASQVIRSILNPIAETDLRSIEYEWLNFRTHLGYPRAVPNKLIRQIVRVELALLVCMLVIFALHWGAKSIFGQPSADEQYRTAVEQLDGLRHKNELFAAELERSKEVRIPRLAACNFLKAVASAAPKQSWLNSISYSSSGSETAMNFALVGFSLDEEDPLRFSDSLRNNREMRSVVLTKGAIVQSGSSRPETTPSGNHLTKFEITGQYER